MTKVMRSLGVSTIIISSRECWNSVTVRGLNPGEGDIFRTRPERPFLLEIFFSFKNLLRKLVFLKSDKNHGYFTWRSFHIYDNISLNSSEKEKNRSCWENRNYVQQPFFFPSFFENRAVYEIMSKNIVQPEGPQMTSQHGAYVLNAG